jgi:PqqD family protein of HPr-rel-A system
MPAQVFAAPAPDLLIARPLGSLVAYYHRPSGQTHVVTSPVPEILSALQTHGPLNLANLLAALGLTEGEAVLSERLAELEARGLVTRR